MSLADVRQPWIGLPGRVPAWAWFVFALPTLAGLAGRLAKGGLWFTDYGALACGGERLRAGVGLYDPAIACADPNAAAFVYLPWVARSMAMLQAGLGEGLVRAFYIALFLAAAGLLVWAPQGRAAAVGTPRARARFLGFLTGSAFTAGNVAVLLHGAVAAAGLLFTRTSWLFVAVVGVAGAVKPVFLTYLAVVALARRSVGWRARRILAGAALGLAPFILFATQGGAEAQAWRALLSHFVYTVTPGEGLFGWLALVGLPAGGLPGAAVALAWAGTVTLCGLAVAERERLGETERLWLGLACATLANPRLMSEDLFLLGPGLLVAARAGGAERLSQAVTVACGLALAGALLDLGDLATRIATLILASVLVAAALRSRRP